MNRHFAKVPSIAKMLNHRIVYRLLDRVMISPQSVYTAAGNCLYAVRWLAAVETMRDGCRATGEEVAAARRQLAVCCRALRAQLDRRDRELETVERPAPVFANATNWNSEPIEPEDIDFDMPLMGKCRV